MTPKPRIQHISCLDFIMKSYFMEYIKYLVIPVTNKHLNSDMNLIEYFHVIGCHLIMACYVGHSVRDLFLKGTITPQKGASVRLNHIVSERLLQKITQVMSYTNLAIPELNDPFFPKEADAVGVEQEHGSAF